MYHWGGAELFDELRHLLEDSKSAYTVLYYCYLFEGFVVDKARGIFGNVELSLLYVFTELPEDTDQKSA